MVSLRLTDVEHVDEELAEALAADGWTVGLLATTRPKALTRYKGVGLVKAGRIISEAARLVNESMFAERGLPVPGPDEDMGAYVTQHFRIFSPPGPAEEVRRSARVQRIYEARGRQ